MNGRALGWHGAWAAALIAIFCAGSLAAATEDIRDIRGPKFIVPAWLVPALLAGAVLLAWGAYRAWRWLRRRQRPRVPLPFEVALQRLEDIRPLMQPPSAREFSTAVSDIVRRYIEQRFDVIATHQTTEEFLHDLLKSSNASLARHRALLSDFLHQCDLVKFADMSLTPQSMEQLHHSARAFVLETAKPDEATETGVATQTRAATEIRDAPQPTAAKSQPTAAKEAHDSLPSA
jgi:HAMP domain-containing protein